MKCCNKNNIIWYNSLVYNHLQFKKHDLPNQGRLFLLFNILLSKISLSQEYQSTSVSSYLSSYVKVYFILYVVPIKKSPFRSLVARPSRRKIWFTSTAIAERNSFRSCQHIKNKCELSIKIYRKNWGEYKGRRVKRVSGYTLAFVAISYPWRCDTLFAYIVYKIRGWKKLDIRIVERSTSGRFSKEILITNELIALN